MAEQVYDVVAVNHTDKKVTVWYRDKGYDNADAIICMGVARRGVDEQFYSMTKPGMYQDGDTWTMDGLIDNPEPPDPDYIHSGGMMFPRGPWGLVADGE